MNSLVIFIIRFVDSIGFSSALVNKKALSLKIHISHFKQIIGNMPDIWPDTGYPA